MQIQFCPVKSVQTTRRYLGCKQKLRNALNDGIDLAATLRGRKTLRIKDSGIDVLAFPWENLPKTEAITGRRGSSRDFLGA